MNKEFNKEEYNKMCAEFLGWELCLAKTSLNWQDGTFMDWDDEEEFWIENPTEEFKKFRILCHPEEVGLGYDIKLFKSYHYKSGLKFDSDWNWIMEVVEKINNPTNGIMVSIHSNSCLITDYGTRGKWNLNRSANIVRVVDVSSRKDAVVQAIWEFLNWYKTQTV